ncbi:MAG: hypothetical protein IKG32_02600 [Clostridia bacterium]|nr:hypothetical protein [Clostridia bacterium]
MPALGLSLEDRNILWYSTDQKDRFLREGVDEKRVSERLLHPLSGERCASALVPWILIEKESS